VAASVSFKGGLTRKGKGVASGWGTSPTLLLARAWPGTPSPVQFYTRRGSSHSRDFLGDLQFSGTCLRASENPTQPQVHFWAVIRAALTGATEARFRSQHRIWGEHPRRRFLSLAVGGQARVDPTRRRSTICQAAHRPRCPSPKTRRAAANMVSKGFETRRVQAQQSISDRQLPITPPAHPHPRSLTLREYAERSTSVSARLGWPRYSMVLIHHRKAPTTRKSSFCPHRYSCVAPGGRSEW
jgi:hypothetical protein